MNNKITLQEYFYIGYIYLIVLGIISDAVYYGIFGVAYLNYTSILDALFSPISLLTDNWILSIILSIAVVLMYLYVVKLMPKIYQKLRVKKWYAKIYNIEKWDKVYKKLENKSEMLKMMMVMFFITFVTMRTGMAIGMKKKLAEKDAKANFRLFFKDNTILDVKRIGQNSSYFFYIIPGEKEITITPIADNLKQIKRIPKKSK